AFLLVFPDAGGGDLPEVAGVVGDESQLEDFARTSAGVAALAITARRGQKRESQQKGEGVAELSRFLAHDGEYSTRACGGRVLALDGGGPYVQHLGHLIRSIGRQFEQGAEKMKSFRSFRVCAWAVIAMAGSIGCSSGESIMSPEQTALSDQEAD